MDFRERSDLQLLRVSKRAHELKKMIDYWSKSSNSNGQQNDIFNDLLIGTVELQESLLMLSRLQIASSNILMKKTRQSEREEFAEQNSIDLSRYNRLQERRLSADSALTNYKQEMKQEFSDKFNKFVNEKVTSNKNSVLPKKVEFSAHAKKLKAPNLIARLMGLEDFPSDDQIEVKKKEKVLKRSQSHGVNNKSLDEIIETMRSTGFLASEQLMSKKYGASLSKKDGIPPIVIMKSLNLPYREREERNLISETSDSILEDKVSDIDCEFSENLEQNEVMNFEKEKMEPPQRLTAASVFKGRKMTDDLKKMEINGKKQVEKMKLKAIREPMKMTPTEKMKAEKLQATERLTSQTNRSNEQDRKNKFSVRSTSFNSISSVKEEKISAGRPIGKSNKTEDKKIKYGKLTNALTESPALSRSKSILAADSLLKQAQKDPTKPFKKDEIRKGRKVICEVMPRNYQAGRSVEMIEESIRKSQYKPPTKNAAEIRFLLKTLLSKVIDDDACYEDTLYYMLEKDLHCNETILNVIWDEGWDDWICMEEGDEVAMEVSERIFFRLLVEVAKDLI
ncbi:hypothetical protein M5K25_024274 [Dendrobium thyrsiflorum]|uniref:DUF3741 domain-containing protein n=1 Tax=Dendrobium thyrsiflorum TaxID=117978 RepID=A0ABD0U1I8_DENTH